MFSDDISYINYIYRIISFLCFIYKFSFPRYDISIIYKSKGWFPHERSDSDTYNVRQDAHAFEYLKQDEAHTIDQQIELVQISSFSPFEEKRAIRFKELLTEADLDPVMDEVHNVYAHIHGTGNGPTLYVSAHLDTVFPPETPLPVKREGTKIYAPGIGDDTRGLAEILTLARAIKESGLKPVGDIIIGGNVGEEGLGDLRACATSSHKIPTRLTVLSPLTVQDV